MKTKEEIFDASANKFMKQWSLRGFKKAFASLFMTIMDAMDAYAKEYHASQSPAVAEVRELPNANDLTDILWAIKMGNMQIEEAVTKIRNQVTPVISSLKKSNEEKDVEIKALKGLLSSCEKFVQETSSNGEGKE